MSKQKRQMIYFGVACIMAATIGGQDSLAASSSFGQEDARSQLGGSGLDKGTKQLVLTSVESPGYFELRVNLPVAPDRISGTFRQGEVGVAFDSSRNGETLSFVISTLSGRELYRISQDEEYIKTKILDGRLKSTFELRLLEAERERKRRGGGKDEMLGMTVEGDVGVVEEYASLPELALLPQVSRLLGQELGYTGTNYPATLPIHVMALSLHTRKSVTVQRPSSGRSTNSQKLACEPYPFQNSDCWGMCGPGCTCWSWVCGDCCFHTGCAVHDDYCRTWLGFAHPYCIDFWIPFFVGGGC